jgi:predicted NAD/FAD-binding protein
MTQDAAGFSIDTGDGTPASFDRVVLATDAREAHRLVSPNPQLAPIARELGRYEYFDTTIAIHGDRTLMPENPRDWSVVNVRWDGTHSALSVWNPRAGLPVFKSWVSFDERLPEPLYAVARYEHGAITPEYFDAQRRLAPLQGTHGLWVAGLYAADADSHESALRSAVAVARELAPGSHRLRIIDD